LQKLIRSLAGIHQTRLDRVAPPGNDLLVRYGKCDYCAGYPCRWFRMTRGGPDVTSELLLGLVDLLRLLPDRDFNVHDDKLQTHHSDAKRTPQQSPYVIHRSWETPVAIVGQCSKDAKPCPETAPRNNDFIRSGRLEAAGFYAAVIDGFMIRVGSRRQRVPPARFEK